MKTRWRTLLLGIAVAGIGIGLTSPSHVLASCFPLDLAAIDRTDSTTVFAGTVQGVQAGHVFLHIDAWFLGKDPVEAAEVIGGNGSNDPGVITSVDWTPHPGDRYVVVAERAGPQGFVTKPCQQVLADPASLEHARTIFGAALQPPFGVPGSSSPSAPPSDAPGAASPSPTPVQGATSAAGPLPFAILGGLVLVAATLAAWRLRRPRPPA